MKSSYDLMIFGMELIKQFCNTFLEELHNPNDTIEETRIIGFPCFLMTQRVTACCKVKQKCILPYPFPVPCQRVMFYDFLPIATAAPKAIQKERRKRKKNLGDM